VLKVSLLWESLSSWGTMQSSASADQLRRRIPLGSILSLVSRYQADLDHKLERKRLTAAMLKHTNPLLISILHILATTMFILIRENSITKSCAGRKVKCFVFRRVRKIAKGDY
jgi:divalent metal cation (Fe/Co/Zn/Cd) transporter